MWEVSFAPAFSVVTGVGVPPVSGTCSSPLLEAKTITPRALQVPPEQTAGHATKQTRGAPIERDAIEPAVLDEAQRPAVGRPEGSPRAVRAGQRVRLRGINVPDKDPRHAVRARGDEGEPLAVRRHSKPGAQQGGRRQRAEVQVKRTIVSV